MSDPIRELHRIIDARVAQALRDTQPEYVRGVVMSVQADTRSLSARLDLADIPTQGIAYPVGMEPLVGDDVLVLRRKDGLLLVRDILRRAE